MATERLLCAPIPAGMGNTTTITISPPITSRLPSPHPTNNPITLRTMVISQRSTFSRFHNSFCTSQRARAEQKGDVLSSGVHNSREPAAAVNGAANRARTGTGSRPVETGSRPVETGLDRLETGLDRLETGLDRLETGSKRVETGLQQNDAAMFDVAVPVQLIPTPAHPIARSHYSTPSFGAAATAPVPAIAVVRAAALSSPSPPVKLGTTLWLDADLRSRADLKTLRPGPANNYAMLAHLVHKHATARNISYSPANMMPGMKRSMHVTAYGADKMAAMMAKQRAAAAGAVSSSLPHVGPPVTSHRFHLGFDTDSNTRNAVLFLDSIGLCPTLPPPAYVIGQVKGIPYHESDDDVMARLQEHAWYVGGAPSLEFSRAVHHAMRGLVDTMCRDEIYFRVLKSEYAHARSMPASSAFPLRLLDWEAYTGPRITLCTHCYERDPPHTRNTCPQAHVMNKEGKHGACTACRSFEHAVRSCPVRREATYVCKICNAGAHNMSACPQVRGYYTKSGPRGSRAVDVYAPSHAQDQTRPRGAWANRPPPAQTQQQQQQQQQPQQQQRSARKPSRAPLPHRHDPELAEIVKLLREEVNSMRAQLAAQTASITQLAATNAQQMQIIVQLTANIAHSSASGGIAIGMHAADAHAPVVSTSRAMTANPVPMHAPKPRTPSVDPSQPSMLQFASPKAVPTSNTYASLASSSAPTTPTSTASPHALAVVSPIVPISDATGTTPRRKKAGSGRKRVQSMSPVRSPVDDPALKSPRRASLSAPASAANLSGA